MTSKRPYLLRAVYEWIVDNDMTPHLWVNADHPSAVVPGEFVEEGRIILNISPMAVQGLSIGNDMIRFSARFSGRAMQVEMAPQAVIGLLSKETADGMLFAEDDPAEAATEDGDETATPEEETKKPPRPSLRVVK
jgi:stringent starvation protein B